MRWRDYRERRGEIIGLVRIDCDETDLGAPFLKIRREQYEKAGKTVVVETVQDRKRRRRRRKPREKEE